MINNTCTHFDLIFACNYKFEFLPSHLVLNLCIYFRKYTNLHMFVISFASHFSFEVTQKNHLGTLKPPRRILETLE